MSCKNLTRYVVCGQLKSAMHELSAGAYADWRDPSDYDRTPLMYQISSMQYRHFLVAEILLLLHI